MPGSVTGRWLLGDGQPDRGTLVLEPSAPRVRTAGGSPSRSGPITAHLDDTGSVSIPIAMCTDDQALDPHGVTYTATLNLSRGVIGPIAGVVVNAGQSVDLNGVIPVDPRAPGYAVEVRRAELETVAAAAAANAAAIARLDERYLRPAAVPAAAVTDDVLLPPGVPTNARSVDLDVGVWLVIATITVSCTAINPGELAIVLGTATGSVADPQRVGYRINNAGVGVGAQLATLVTVTTAGSVKAQLTAGTVAQFAKAAGTQSGALGASGLVAIRALLPPPPPVPAL